jgi:rhomboid protease GluP
MKCPDCDRMNFNWASRCDHCGRPLADRPEAIERPVVAAAPDASHSWVEDDERQNREFIQALSARTPRIIATPALIALNVAVFLAMAASGLSPARPLPDALIRWGAEYGPLTTHGQWWRLITAMFIHIGAVHLLMNMFVLWQIGRFTERLFGHVGFAVLYLLAGLAGGITSLVWHPVTVAAGASGAIFGLYGGLLGFLLIRRDSMPTDTINRLLGSGVTFLLVNLAYGLVRPEVDVSAHLGGFVSGVPVGGALALPLAADLTARIWRSALVTLAGAALVGVAAVQVPVVDDFLAEVRRLEVVERESIALFTESANNLGARTLSREEFAGVVSSKVLPSWEAERAKITSLRIPEPQRTVAVKVGEYMSLRAESWRLTAEGVRTNDARLMGQGELKMQAASVALAALRSLTSQPAVKNHRRKP